jgi:hypothetical protein
VGSNMSRGGAETAATQPARPLMCSSNTWKHNHITGFADHLPLDNLKVVGCRTCHITYDSGILGAAHCMLQVDLCFIILRAFRSLRSCAASRQVPLTARRFNNVQSRCYSARPRHKSKRALRYAAQRRIEYYTSHCILLARIEPWPPSARPLKGRLQELASKCFTAAMQVALP